MENSATALHLPSNDPTAIAVASAIKVGDVEELKRLLGQQPDLAQARVVDESGAARSLIHVAAVWPGHFPNGARTIAMLIAAGADANAPVGSPRVKHAETPLHWAASSNDVAVLDAFAGRRRRY